PRTPGSPLFPYTTRFRSEFNLSETAFVLPVTAPTASYRVRIFTPTHEIPFAGHPSVGSAVTVARRGLVSPGPGGVLVQECCAGLDRKSTRLNSSHVKISY